MNLHALTTAALSALHLAGHEPATIVLTDTQHAVAHLKTLPIADAVIADIHLFTARTDLNGSQKRDAAIANTLPALVVLAEKGGVKATVDDVKDIGRELVQSIYNDAKSTTAGAIATALIGLVHHA